MKRYYILAVLVVAYALFGVISCSSPALKINTPAVQAQVVGDIEKDLLAGGGALLITGGNGGAAVAAITAQEVQNLPSLQKALNDGTPATVIAPTTPVAP